MTSPPRPLLRLLLMALAVLVGLGLDGSADPQGGLPEPSPAMLYAAGRLEVRAWYVRPPAPAPGHPRPPGAARAQVVLVLHGMAGDGQSFADRLAEQADRHAWLVVAPTFDYGDWRDPDQIVREDPALIAWLSDFVAHLSERVAGGVQPKVLVIGYSRGAQLAVRFAEVHPAQTLAVVALAAGTYTLPLTTQMDGRPLDFPFGVADLARYDGGLGFDPAQFQAVPIWVGVGGADADPDDVPRAWDPYLGTTRLARAQAFVAALRHAADPASLQVFADAGHGPTPEMLSAAATWLAQTQAAGPG